MKNILWGMILVTITVMISCNSTNVKTESMNNPLLSDFTTPYGVPPFDQIKPEHYVPAFTEAMKIQKDNISKIDENTDEPTFENTIEAFENSGELLRKVGSVFSNMTEAATSDTLKEISKKVFPMLASHRDDIRLDSTLFSKIKKVYDNRNNLNLTTEQQTLLKKTYRDFIRGGANLKNKNRERFREINKQLSLLFLRFSDNVLEENNRFELVIDNEKDLEGLPENAINAARKTAIEKGYENKWVFTIHKPSMLPFLENAKNRNLREKIYKAYITKGDHNDSLDNKKNVNEIVNLRIERAHLLGYKNHAEFMLEENMAKTPENVYNLLDKLMTPALRVAKNEVANMQKIIDAEGNHFKVEAWDYPYYQAKVKEQKYAFNENDLRPYLKLENVRDGMFWVANKLYGITFTRLDSMPVYNPDCEVYLAKESNGDDIGILYLDYFPRDNKQQGAWCTSFREERYKDGKRILPIMSVVYNLSKPVGDTPALLSVDETQTMFHEFGHSLDGLFSNKHYASLDTPQDFVELPSQIMENWAMAPEVLKHYAKHYQTGEIIPDELIKKIEKSGKFNQGFMTTEYLAACYLDMDYHTLNQEVNLDVNKFEKQSMDKIHLIPEIDPRYRSTYFLHIFSGSSYSAGYYDYVWAEVLDADAFEDFKEHGIFDKTTAAAFRTNILELGGTEDAMDLYRKFRGADPKIDALLNRRGLN